MAILNLERYSKSDGKSSSLQISIEISSCIFFFMPRDQILLTVLKNTSITQWKLFSVLFQESWMSSVPLALLLFHSANSLCESCCGCVPGLPSLCLFGSLKLSCTWFSWCGCVWKRLAVLVSLRNTSSVCSLKGFPLAFEFAFLCSRYFWLYL